MIPEIVRNIASWVILFVVYAFLGWTIETAISFYRKRRFCNRGFLIGPICPIYGFGAIIATLAVSKTETVWVIFCVCSIVGGAIEYSTSVIMEKLFHARWWDYHDKPFHINGRVCLPYLAAFGVIGILAVKVISPLIFSFTHQLSDSILVTIASIFLVLIILDIAGSLLLIIKFRVATNLSSADATEEITKHIQALFMEKGKLNKRLVKAFPEMQVKKPEPRKKRKDSV